MGRVREKSLTGNREEWSKPELKCVTWYDSGTHT